MIVHIFTTSGCFYTNSSPQQIPFTLLPPSLLTLWHSISDSKFFSEQIFRTKRSWGNWIPLRTRRTPVLVPGKLYVQLVLVAVVEDSRNKFLSKLTSKAIEEPVTAENWCYIKCVKHVIFVKKKIILNTKTRKKYYVFMIDLVKICFDHKNKMAWVRSRVPECLFQGHGKAILVTSNVDGSKKKINPTQEYL